MEKVQCQYCSFKGLPATDGYCANCGRKLVRLDTSLDVEPEGEAASGDQTREIDLSEKSTVAESVDPALALQLEFKHHYLCAGQHGLIPFRFINVGQNPIRKLSFAVESAAFYDCREPIRIEDDVNLSLNGATENRDCGFHINPDSGFYAVKFSGNYVDKNENLYAFRGSFTLYLRGPHEDKATLTIEDAYGLMTEKIDVDAFDKIKIKDSSGLDLGRLETASGRRASGWIPLRVEEDVQQTLLLRRWLEDSKRPDRPAGPVAKSRRVSSKMAIMQVVDESTSKIVHIWTGENCRIGRKPGDVDLVCLLLPGTDENITKNEQISRSHLRLAVKRNTVFLEDLKSTNGTFVDTRRIAGREPLREGQVIGLANKLFLRYHDFRSLGQTREVKRVLNNCTTAMDCTSGLSSTPLEDVRGDAPLEAFVLRRQNNYQERLEYLFLQKSAILGSSRYAAVLLPYASVSEQHARLVLDGRRYYLEDLGSKSGTKVNGKPLRPYVKEPLGAEADIFLGDVNVEFRVPEG